MPTVLHVLPHRGGGGETYIDHLDGGEEFRHPRLYLSGARTPLAAAPSIAAAWPRLAGAARRADILHAHGDVAALLSLPLRPAVISTHGLHLLRRSSGPRRAAVAAGLRRVVATARTVICETAAERDDLLAIGAAPERLQLIPNGIPLPARTASAERAAVRAELRLADDDVAAIFIGQLEARKDPMTAIDAARRAGPPLVLLLAGDGPLAELVEVARGGPIRPLGFRRDTHRLLGAADVFVAPSHREGVSYALLEAMGHGLPVIAADGPGSPEALGPAGIVVPASDVAAFAEALAALAGDPGERARLGALARERVAGEYGLELFLRRTGAVYRAALGSPAR